MNFTHLHVHTQYSLLDGSNKIEEYVARVKELGMDSAAITDHGAMYGCIDFYKAARAAGIKPIMGCEVYVAPKSRFDRELGNQEDRYYHLVLLAENNVGYANLMKIVSKGFVEGFYYKPRVDLELKEKYHHIPFFFFKFNFKVLFLEFKSFRVAGQWWPMPLIPAIGR